MPFYHKLGNIPHKRHTQHRRPDGELYTVPFAALVVNGKRLVETHSLLRAPSASTWVLLRQRDKNVARSGLLAVGGVLYNSDLSQIAKSRGYGVQLSNLPGSQEEADAASQTLGPLLKQSVEIQAQAATETAVKSALKQQREVVHLAVHGLARSWLSSSRSSTVLRTTATWVAVSSIAS